MSIFDLDERLQGLFAHDYDIPRILMTLQALTGSMPDVFIYYWSSEHSDGELDFFIQKGSCILPIEVKAEENVRAKSLRHFILANPSLKGLRFSMADYQEQDWMPNIPLYAVSELAYMQ